MNRESVAYQSFRTWEFEARGFRKVTTWNNLHVATKHS